MTDNLAAAADDMIFSFLGTTDFNALVASQSWSRAGGIVSQHLFDTSISEDISLPPRSDGASTPPFPPPPVVSEESLPNRTPVPPEAHWIWHNGRDVQAFCSGWRDGSQLWWWHLESDECGLLSADELDTAQRAYGAVLG